MNVRVPRGVCGPGGRGLSLARALLGAVPLAVACVALSACGGAAPKATLTPGATATAPPAQAAPSPPAGTSSSATAAPNSSSNSSSHTAGASLKLALAGFESCLSKHGVKLPAHTGSALSLTGVDTKTAGYRKALAACRPLLLAALRSGAKSARPLPSPAPRAAPPAASAVKVPASVTAIMTRFTTCMRGHGVPGFPEPTGASFELSGTNIDSQTAAYKSAEAKCTSILTALDPRG